MNDCIFCKIINEEIPSFKIFENQTHLAFLDINPNTRGTTLVIPKLHITSTIINMDTTIYSDTLKTAKIIAENLAQKLKVEKVGIAIEGTGVDHFHVKLYPFYINSKNVLNTTKEAVFNEFYPGYLTTQIGPQADFENLKELAEELHF